ncbi:IPT/TIG domain-containing protein [Hymenobacter sp. UYCo722]|uniref:IPT/TIG domain-containing protein n=1 Tax=Hymenobacter sp. UYCo722 TaxID=3156335 RepID=UPI003391BA29
MKYFYRLGLFLGLMVQVLLRPAVAVAAPFTPGNIVVARVGEGGTAALTSTSTAVFLDEYTPGGTLVQSVALPTSISGNNRALTVSGTTPSELGLARSADGRSLVLAGYGTSPGGTPTVSSSSAANVVRVVGLVGADGSVDTSTSLQGAFDGVSVRAVASPDGNSFYVIGANSGVQYAQLGGFSSTQLNTAPTNLRGVRVAAGNLYITAASSTYYGVSMVGTGLPTTAGQPVTVLPGFPGATTGSSSYAFYMADLSAAVPGIDVIYVADDRGATGGIQKWSLVGSTWTLNGTIASPSTATVRGLDGNTTGSTVSLVATSPNGLFILSDNSGYNVAPTLSSLPAAIITNPTNTAFRGVAFAPSVPAPTITSFTPTSGLADGTVTVTVTGTDFTGATAVTLNGVAITGFTVVNGTTITFVVPTGATSGPIAITTVGGTATSTGTFMVNAPANPMPAITSLAPNTAVAGSAAFTLTVNGTGFVSGSVVNFNGAALATTYGSATQLTAPVPASAVATAGAYNVTVTSPAPGGGTSAAATFTVTTPAPTITSFTPTSGLADGTVTVTVTGTDFTGATAVTLNGVAITGFTVVNGTTITFVVPAGASSGTIAVTTPTGTATSTGTFTVIVPNTAPVITSLTPSTATAGSAGFTLTVNGTGFLSSTVINFNGTALATTFVSATQVAALVPASAVATVGTYAVTATNPAPGGGTSAGVNFTVTTPAPTIASFTPTSGLANGTVTVTVTGTDFTGATAVTLNGVAITGFTVVNGTTITFAVPTGATSGPIAVTTPSGTATSTGTFTVTLPAPTIASLSPSTAVAGSAAFTLTVNGTGFLSGSVVNFNGTALTTTFGSATQLTAAVPASAVATAGTYNVTVANPSANQGGTSAAAAFTVTTAAPTITSFTPTSGPVSTATVPTTVTVTGTDFTGATAVTLNGVTITGFTVVNNTTITFNVPTGATSGVITVTTPTGTATSTGIFSVAPAITALSPNAQVAGGPALTLTITGTNFTTASTVNFNSVSYTPTSATATTIVVTIPASVLATVGAFPVSVTTVGGTSNVFTFTVSNASTANAYENFEAGTKTSYAAGPVTLTSGVWTFANALIGDSFADKFNGLKSARIRTGGSIAMTFDKPTGAGTVIINAALYGTTDTGASFLLEQSTDGGTTYTTVPGAPATLTGTLTPYTFTVNTAGNVRFRISNTVTVTTNSFPRINIDDISISNFTAAPTITSFTPTTGGPGATVTLTGTNLTGATAVRIGTFTVTNFTVVNATTITFVVPTGTGSVNGFISVTTPGGIATSTTPFNLVSATLAANALPGLTVFPNPATDRLTVELPTSAPATVALRDLAGRLVLAPAPLGADHQLLLPASLASGVYLLEVRQGATVAIRRIEKN